MFKDTLREVVEGTEGGIAGVLMDYEGFAVDHWAREDAEFDIQTVGMELSVVLKDVRRASEQLDTGKMSEFVFHSEKLSAVVRMINTEYVVALTLRPNGNPGKGRFLLRLAAPKLIEALA
jgi:predicted regulator of Ras-like GTPase activity (Roadblock/LC7/MglB family)